MYKAAGNVLSQVLQPGLDDGIIGTDFPGYPLCLFVDLSGDRRFFPAQNILISSANNTILINRKLKEHIGVPLFLLCESPDSERQPLWLLTRLWRRRRRRLRSGLISKGYCLLRILLCSRRLLAIYVNLVPLISDVHAIVINRRLISSVVIRIDSEKSSGGC